MSSRLSYALVVVAVFALVGPAISALVFGLLFTVVAAFTEPGIGLMFVYASIIFLPLAYLIGGLQAAFAGAVTALVVWRQGSAPFWVPLAAALLAAAFVVARAHEDWVDSAIMIAVHALSALACWALLRGLLAPPSGS